MSQKPIREQERQLLERLIALSIERQKVETESVSASRSERAGHQRSFKEESERREAAYRADRTAADAAHEEAIREARERLDEEHRNTVAEYETEKFKIGEQADHDIVATKKAWQEARWTAETVFEAQEPQPGDEFKRTSKSLKLKQSALESQRQLADDAIRRYRQRRPAKHDIADDATEPPASLPDTLKTLEERLSDASSCATSIRRLRSGRLFEGFKPFLVPLLVAAVAAAIVGWQTQWQFDQWLVEAGIAAGIVSVIILVTAYFFARGRIRDLSTSLDRHVRQGLKLRERALVLASERRARAEAALRRQRDEELEKARAQYEPRLEKIEEVRDRVLRELDERHAASMNAIEKQRAQRLEAIEKEYRSSRRNLEAAYERDVASLHERHAATMREIDDEFAGTWSSLEERWTSGMADVHEAVKAICRVDSALFPPWNNDAWTNWTPPDSFPPAIRFGAYDVDLAQLPGGLPEDPRLMACGPFRFDLPAVLDFPAACSLLMEVGEHGRDAAVDTLQNVMTRVLTTFPPGKVRFTIIDPVGLGRNFAGFMHLADYEEAFVADRIWTETRHIEQRLADLTEHMENVIQKYLRNDFDTITEYNRHAGEIAEPFRFLVIANFPVNFSDVAARRLISIIESGARCGVYTLISSDTRQSFPQGFQASDLRKGGVRLIAKEDGFVCGDETFARLPLALDPPPSPEFLTRTLHIVGESARDSTRVEVPFEYVIPERDKYWSHTSERGIDVPLGRAGATKLQYLSIGQGITQHVLIAGKTGSGKSTLLHVLITNLALHYHPQEVEFYLVDFKKGVEFKTYATHDLPHARAVAIESDREFGLSVLQRVDAELRRRGEIFRRAGVQDLNSYRRSAGAERIPRTLLIIDEFQEFFTEDDKLAQDAALLLDRLVRQGRAFGIHIILGSQTLAGAYTLARSTMGQMAVRIALQCSEADAMLIMSDDNSAARLLSRPGEAIYNDQSGLVEGNSPFQIVWLSESTREKHLREIDELRQASSYRPPEAQIVFEGNVPADVRRNALLEDALATANGSPAPTAPQAWLGDAIAIKDPTAAVFRRQSGCNLMMVGQHEESALAMMETSIISLAAQMTPARRDGEFPRFVVLDGTPADAPFVGQFEKLAAWLPHGARTVGWHDVEKSIADLAEELARRQESHRTDAPPIYLIVFGLQRFRMLRQSDDFGFSMGGEDKPKTPDKHFADIIRDGPPHGIHVLCWCDTANNLTRTFDRQSLREFDMRVLFQMSSTDSSSLIDSPLASTLGSRRALYFSEDHGIVEKFRPYAVPEPDWLEEVERRMTATATSLM